MLRHPRLGSCQRAAALLVAVALAGCGSGGLRPEPPGERMLMAEIALERGQYRLAAREYRAAAAASRDPKIAERAARVAFDNGQDTELEHTARAWLAREPGSETARRFLAVALLQLDRREAARSEFAKLIKTAYATPAQAFTALRESLGDLRNDTGAARVVASLAADYPEVPEAQYAAAVLALAAGDSPAALAAAERATALKPGWREAVWVQVRARIAGGDCRRGLQQSAALAAESNDADRLTHAWLLTACDRGAEARPYFDDLSRGTFGRAEALEGLAAIDLDARRFDPAAARYTEMLATGRNSDRAYFGLAQVADRRGEIVPAIRLYARITAGPRAIGAQLRAYRLLLQRGEPLTAARLLDDFATGVPDDRVGLTAGRAQVLAEFGHAREAEALLTRAIAAYPDREELRYARAAVLEHAGELPAALAELRAVVHERPDDPAAQNALGFTLADHGRELPEAERLIRAALNGRPDSAAIRDSLGWVLYQRGHATDALDWLQRAYAGDPDPEIAVHIGEAQWSLGQRADAANTWREALERTPGDTRLKDVLERHRAAIP